VREGSEHTVGERVKKISEESEESAKDWKRMKKTSEESEESAKEIGRE